MFSTTIFPLGNRGEASYLTLPNDKNTVLGWGGGKRNTIQNDIVKLLNSPWVFHIFFYEIFFFVVLKRKDGYFSHLIRVRWNNEVYKIPCRKCVAT